MTDWRKNVLTHWDLINSLARRRFANQTLAEEAALAVMDGLEKDDWLVVRKHAGLASFSTYLAAVTWRLLEDFSRRRFGRIRPPSWIRSLGGLWLDLFRLLCLERLALTDAVEHISDRRPTEERHEIENAAYAIRREVVDCGRQQAKEEELNENTEQGDSEKLQSQTSQAEKLEEEEQQKIFKLLFEMLTGSEENLSERGLAALRVFQPQLTSEERLLLKLCYRDGHSVIEAGRMLGMNRFQIHGRLRRILERVRLELARIGLAEEIRQLLNE